MRYILLMLLLSLALPGRAQDEKPANDAKPVEAPEKSDAKPESKPDEAAKPATAVASTVGKPRITPPGDYYIAFDVTTSRSVVGRLETTALGKLFADAEVQTVWKMLQERVAERNHEIEKLTKIAEELDVEQGLVEELSKIAAEHAGDVYPERIRGWVYPYGEDDEEAAAIIAMVLTDEDLPKIKKSIEALAEKLIDDKVIAKSSESADFGGQAVTVFDSADSDGIEYRFENAWYAFSGNELYVGVDSLDRLRKATAEVDAKLDEQLARAYGGQPGIGGVVVNVAAIIEDHGDEDSDEDLEKAMKGLGLDGVRGVAIGVAISGEHFRQTGFLDIPDGPRGLLAALRAAPAEGAGAIPALPAPKPVLAQIDGSIDVAVALEKVMAMENQGKKSPEASPEAKIAMDLVKEAFGGGFSLSLSAPHVFSLMPIPRLVVAVDVVEEGKFDNLLALVKSKAEGITFSESTHNETDFTTVLIPNNPSPLVPTFARIGKAFYLADSPKTLQAVIDGLKTEKSDEAAPALADTLDLGEGFTTTVRMRYSPREIYNVMARKYVPLLQLGIGQMFKGSGSKPLLSITEMPKPEKIIEYLGEGTAELAWGPGGLYGVASASTGDPITTIVLSFYAPLAGWLYGIGLDEARADLERRILHRRALKIRAALTLYRASFGGGKRYPSRLSELLDRGLVENTEVFTVPSDKSPATLEYENEDGEILDTPISYKYLPASKLIVKEDTLDSFDFNFGAGDLVGIGGGSLFSTVLEKGEETKDGNVTIILYELNSNRHGGRMVLTAEGGVYHLTEDKFESVVGKQ